ncbi:MAG: GNAT family protein [Micavibrio sp.]
MIWPRAVPGKTSQSGYDRFVRSARLTMRPAMMTDFESWVATRRKNQSFLQPFEPRWTESWHEKSSFERRVKRLDEDWKNDRTYAFLIFKNGKGGGDGDLIGGININNVARGAAQYAALGYWLDESHQGQGHMTEAARAVLAYAFSTLLLQRMNAATLVHNGRSRAMLERIGFGEEGFAKAYIQINGWRQDHILYGLNGDDFLRASGYR